MTIDGRQRGLPTPPRLDVDLDEADRFFRQRATEDPSAPDPKVRHAAAAREFSERGVFTHTTAELEFGARVAWRNANRCIGRLYWRSLVIRDRRHVRRADSIAHECVEHLKLATNGGKIRPVITIFAADEPGRPAPRIRNEQLVRYAGRRQDGATVGDPRFEAFTRWVQSLGWSGKGSAFDVLPLVIDTASDGTAIFDIPEDAVLEVELSHPELPWFADLGLRWHAVPAISSMPLRIGGLTYPTAPFNGWYMGTEIGSRNLVDADRYDMLVRVGRQLGLNTDDERSLWKDRVLVEINRAVLWSFDRAGVKIADHHAESERFMAFVAKEHKAGRTPTAEWSWVVPPMSGASLPVYHQYYDESVHLPGFLPSVQWEPPSTDWGDDGPAHRTADDPGAGGCPYHHRGAA
ncbi:nitric oxide synthase oxygenase [Phytoactinopolyspora halotolerans]|uniref:Nitric oxide synthase oxygenase n=1 Tax=Phytoactinopolyspora halotolerans TaxID=1981512 RepID=A0A6L9S7V0_9ACTN|nr:nitric oxide synthase oxygenase [Phytoactinopolyspora halotolerans]NEE00050.1 nitric oxide synthase oxygenase [Phytoactinopolyspora halotolerans]